MIQLSLFQSEKKIQRSPITYNSLTIHEKINLKFNEGFFNYYTSYYNYYSRPLFQPIVDRYTKKALEEYRMNAGTFVRLERYLLSKKLLLFP